METAVVKDRVYCGLQTRRLWIGVRHNVPSIVVQVDGCAPFVFNLQDRRAFVQLGCLTLDQTQMQVEERTVDLSPGMAVTVEIRPVCGGSSATCFRRFCGSSRNRCASDS